MNQFENYTKLIKTSNKIGSYVLYVCSRDQRINYNIALNFAINLSKFKKIPLKVLFLLYPNVKNRIFEHYEFMFNGLHKLSDNYKNIGIKFYISNNNIENTFKSFHDVDTIVFDFSPLKGPMSIKSKISQIVDCTMYVVDTHNIVPVWKASPKEEAGAYSIRPKIHKLIDEYLFNNTVINLEDLQNKDSIEIIGDNIYLYPDRHTFELLLSNLNLEKSETLKFEFISGEDKATEIMQKFLHNKLLDYFEYKNNPSYDVLSNLSPYFHYGQIFSLNVVAEIFKQFPDAINYWKNKINEEKDSKEVKSVKSFLEELIIRKELSDNFCFYNKFYKSLEGAKTWAKDTLKKHEKDIREFIYSISDLEKGLTHDKAWNAAQLQLIHTGKIHGYMRMYWAKKLLEWTKNPREALNTAIYLNDKYSIDGYDPNGYTGIMWSICGVHDRPWFERPIFGLIRYMNYSGLSRKFDVESYIKTVYNKITIT